MSILKNLTKALPLVALMLFPSVTAVQANLLITPLQVVIEGRERTKEIILVNTSNDTNTYRLHWEQLEQVEDAGGYVRVSKEERKSRFDLEDFAVFTPRQITLGPNQKQTIRVAVRRPSDIKEGEYKSHLKFSIVPGLSIKEEKNRELGKNEIGVGAQVYASYSIPVVYRVGDYDIDLSIGQPQMLVNPKTSYILINLPVTRTGKHGVIGLIEAYFKPDNAAEYRISALGNANIFSEIGSRQFTLVTQKNTLPAGQLKLIFKQAEGLVSEYKILSEKVISVK